MRVRFTPSARTQYLAAIEYVHRRNPAAARRFHGRAARALRRLARFPRSGHLLPEFPDLPFWEVVVTPYRFFYAMKEQVVWVVAVWHGARMPGPPSDQ
ncbi:MAG: type II toxin-antitoxin system RelE/ParE family toxin [Deltaproteobacteria bacterium]|nr:type II toxin-antitoxin system RelE/ParE family toxin [Deltaproteobacteria bacterium]